MEFKEYQEKAMQTCMESSSNMDYAFTMIMGELGELLEKTNFSDLDTPNADIQSLLLDQGLVAKDIRKGKVAPESYTLNTDVKEVKKEIGDILWGLALLANINGWSLEEVAQMNIDKLSSRKDRDKIEGNGDNR